MKRLLKSEIVKNTGILVGGTVAAQLIPIVLQVFLRRMYAPEVFGVFSVFFSLMSIGVFFFTFRYELSIVNPEKDEDAANLLTLIIMLSFSSFLILLLTILFFDAEISRLVNIPRSYSSLLYLLPFTLFFYSSYLGMQYWLIRKKNFKGISFNKITRRSAEGIVQIILGIFRYTSGLIWGLFVGIISIFFMGLFQSRKSGLDFKVINWGRIKKVAKEYKEYPLFNTLPAFLNTAGLMLPVIFINKFFGSDITGQFDLTRQILAVPTALLSVSLSQVYLQRLSEKFNSRKSIIKDLVGLGAFLAAISLIAFVVIYFFGIQLFTLFFGSNWYDAGLYAELLIFKYLLVFVVSPMSMVFVALKKIKVTSLWQVLYFLSILVLYFFRNRDILDFLQVYVIIDVIMYSFYFLLIVLVVSKYEKSLQ